jgi:chromosomal replication initiation ATPase DnaA
MLDLLREIWSRVQEPLRLRAGEAAFGAWLTDLRPIALERGVCYLEGKNRVVCERVQRLFQSLLEEALSGEIGTRVSVTLLPASETSAPDQLEVGPARPIVDASNQTAFLMLKSLIEGKPLPSPLVFLHGPAGAGKTFLLRWWSQHVEEAPRHFLGEKLVRVFQACLRDRRLDELRGELLEGPALVLDEVHRIAGHRRLHRELLGALQTRERTGSPILMASRWHPREIWNLDPDLAAFFGSGFVTRLDYPGPEARLRYLRALEGAPAHNGRAHDIEALAQQVRGSYTDVRRAWVLQRQSQRAPEKYLQLIDPRSVFERVLRRVAQELGVEADDVVGKSQGRRVSFARQVLSYLCVHEGLSRAEVGRFLGGRSRAAISYATKTLEKRMAVSPQVRARVEEFL